MSLFTDTSVLVNLNLEFGALFFLQEVDNIKKKFKAPSVYSGVLGIDFELAVSIVQFIFLKGRSCFPSAAVAGASLYRGLIINRKKKPLWSNTTLQCVVDALVEKSAKQTKNLSFTDSTRYKIGWALRWWNSQNPLSVSLILQQFSSLKNEQSPCIWLHFDDFAVASNSNILSPENYIQSLSAFRMLSRAALLKTNSFDHAPNWTAFQFKNDKKGAMLFPSHVVPDIIATLY